MPAYCAHGQAQACTYPEDSYTHTHGAGHKPTHVHAYAHIYLHTLWLSASRALTAALA